MTVVNTLLFDSVGSVYLGVVASSALYGMTCIQAYYYFHGTYKDRRFLPTLVVILWVLDSLHQAFFLHLGYHYLVAGYLNASTLLFGVWSVPAGLVVNAIIALLVNGFYVWRYWKLSNNRIITAFCATLLAVHLGLYLTAAIRPFFYRFVVEQIAKSKSVGIASIVLDSVLGLILSIGLIYHLNRSRTGFNRTESLITRLVRITISTGALTTAFLLVELVTYIVAAQTYWVPIISFVVGKLYVNALLASLNLRDHQSGSTTRTQESVSLGLYRSGEQSGTSVKVERVVNIHRSSHDHSSRSIIPCPTKDDPMHHYDREISV